MKKSVLFRFAILGLIVLPVLLGLALSIAFAGTATGLDDLYYTEQEGWRFLDPGITVTSSLDDFSNGYIDIDLTNTTISDQLRIVSSGPLSITGNAVLWNGNRIGTIDFIRNGQNGQPLRINFDATLPNADFETGDLTGWTVDNTQNQMMGQSWAEGPLVLPHDSDPLEDDQSFGSCSATVDSAAAYQGTWGLKLDIGGWVSSGYGTGHCPSVTSSAFSAQAGDDLSLNWLAAETSDYYDVFGFVENQDTGEFQTLFHDTGSSTGGWITLTTTISNSVCPVGTCNNLHFKFINGTYDQTGGQVIGSYLYIDGISVQISAIATDAIIEYILEHIEYQNISDNPLPTKPYTLTLLDASSHTGTNNATIFITAVNDPPTDIALSNNTIDENQPVGTAVGNFSTTDLDIGDTYTYTLVSGTGDTDNGSFSIVGDQLQTAASFDFETQSNYSIRVRSTDAGGLWTEKVFTISVNDVDDPPTLIPSGADPTYFMSDPAIIIDSGITITDVDSFIVSSVVVSITNNFVPTEDLLEFPVGGVNGITGSYDSGTGILTLTGSGSETAADYQAAFRAVKYRNSNNVAPSELDRTVQFNLTGPWGSVAANVIVHVRNPNDADLALAKTQTMPAGSVNAGQQVTYVIAVENSGPDSATNVQVFEAIPAGTTVVDITPSIGQCSIGGICTLGSIPDGGSESVTVTLLVDSGFTGNIITNQASVTADEDDPSSSNNSASASTTIGQSADLSIDKVDLSDPVGPTEGFLYEILVINHGPSDTSNVAITDTLGANLTFAAASPGCTGDVSSPVISCSLSDLPAGTSTKFLIAAIVADVPSGTILNNDVIVASDTFDPDDTNNSDSESTTVRQNLGTSADLSISKSASPDPVTAGETVTYTLTIENNGPGIATNAQVLEMIPAGTSMDSINVDNPDSNFEFCTLSGVCYLGMVTPVTTVTVETVLRVDPGYSAASITNLASVTADQPDPDPADNVASATVNVNTLASLRITKTDLNDPVVSGDLIDYQISLANDGPSDAYNIVITDTIPVNTVFAGASDSCSEANGILTCDLDTIPSGDTESILLRVITNDALTPGTVITNTAFANAGNAQEVSAAAETLVAQTPLNPTDLSISLTDSPDPVVAGETLTYTVNVVNSGPAPATSVLVVDFLPNGLELLETHPSQGLCQIDLTCSLGDLGIGGSATVVYVAKVKSDQVNPLTNVVRVSASNPDLDPSNNEATTTTQVTTTAYLLIDKTVTPDIVTPGADLTYEIVVTNIGPSDARDVVVTDTLPVELTSASYSVSQGSCANDVCTLGRIPAGDSASIVILASVSPDVTEPFTNIAEVGTSTLNLNPITSDDAGSQILGGTDLAVVKSAPATAYAGETITYTVVVYHQGLSDAQNVMMTDELPVGVTFHSASAACSHDNGTVTCTENTLPAGTIVSYDILVTVDGDLEPGTSLENTAIVDSDTFDNNMFNNSDTADTSIVGRIDLVLSKSGPATTIPGRQLVYTIILTNTGPSVARSVDIKDELPDFFSVDDVTVQRTGSGKVACVGLLCQVGDVAVDEIITMYVTATLSLDFTGTEFTNEATVFSDSPDLNQANNSDVQRTVIYKLYMPMVNKFQ